MVRSKSERLKIFSGVYSVEFETSTTGAKQTSTLITSQYHVDTWQKYNIRFRQKPTASFTKVEAALS